jgi:hypothetical protein
MSKLIHRLAHCADITARILVDTDTRLLNWIEKDTDHNSVDKINKISNLVRFLSESGIWYGLKSLDGVDMIPKRFCLRTS